VLLKIQISTIKKNKTNILLEKDRKMKKLSAKGASNSNLLCIIILYMLQKAKRKPHGNNLSIEIYLTVERTEFFNVHLLHYRLHNEYFHKSDVLNDSYNRHNGRRAARLRCCLLHKVIVFIRARLCGQVAIRCVVIFSLSWLDSEIAIRRCRTRFATNN